MIAAVTYIALPLLLAACSALKKKTLVCSAAGIVIFICTFLCLNSAPSGIAAQYELLSEGNASDLPIGFSYPARLLALIFPGSTAIYAVLSVIFAASVSCYVYRFSQCPSFSAVIFAAGGFWLYFVHEPMIFCAAALCMPAFKYASQRRFVRYAVFVLLAVCFRPEALLLLAFYPVLLFPAGLPLLIAGLLAGAALFFINPGDILFQYMSASAQSFPQNGISPLVPAALFLLAAFAALTRRMHTNRDYSETMIITLFAAAVMSLMSVSDIRFMPLAAMLGLAPALTLGGELFTTGKRLAALTFPEKEKNAKTVFTAVSALFMAVLHGIMLVQTGVSEWV